MAINPKDTIWVSHSALSDFKKCPQLYYLRNVKRLPPNSYRIEIPNPYLTLGSIVHRVLQEFPKLHEEEKSLGWALSYFDRLWIPRSSLRGGFLSKDQEAEFKARGIKMIKRFFDHKDKWLTKPYSFPNLPKLPLFGREDVMLIGSIDWVEILTDDTVSIVDFKTGKHEEEEESLQLPIYVVITEKIIDKPVSRVAYWYLDKDNAPKEIQLGKKEILSKIIEDRAKEIVMAREQQKFPCISGNKFCSYCEDFVLVIEGKGRHVGTDYLNKRELFEISP